LAQFLQQPHFVVWDNNDLTTHEVMGGLKNVYAIGVGKPFFCDSGFERSMHVQDNDLNFDAL